MDSVPLNRFLMIGRRRDNCSFIGKGERLSSDGAAFLRIALFVVATLDATLDNVDTASSAGTRFPTRSLGGPHDARTLLRYEAPQGLGRRGGLPDRVGNIACCATATVGLVHLGSVAAGRADTSGSQPCREVLGIR